MGGNFDNRSLADRDSFRAGFSDVDPYQMHGDMNSSMPFDFYGGNRCK